MAAVAGRFASVVLDEFGVRDAAERTSRPSSRESNATQVESELFRANAGLTTWEANRQIDDAVQEVQTMNGVLDESLVAMAALRGEV